ncbi:methyltransferase domain-containing protein [Streptomyces sp. NPDC018031]|uniref:methyltransferase domain-containing protein n=1 Tax=Streptomyces sp. NPDC018031 TaxID=3365033 RepID=UPI0037B2D979
MTPTLVQRNNRHRIPSPTTDPRARVRDWAEIQERMLVPLYEAVYARLGIGPGTHLLGLGCGSGLALLMAAARGARVAGTDPDERRLALARDRLARRGAGHGPGGGPAVRLSAAAPAGVRDPHGAPFTVVTDFELPGVPGAGRPAAPSSADRLRRARALTVTGGAVVLAGWGPPERCATASVLRVAARLADPMCAPARWRPSGRDDLELLAERAGLRPDGSGRVACPFGYADQESAVRGLLSTGWFDAAERATDTAQVRKEVAEALHPHRRPDGTVWMPNVLRYLIARV